MSPSLDDLPDLCILAVFQYLSILELLRTIRLVNTRWSRLINAELNRRRSLIIVDDRDFNLSRLQLDQHQSHLIEHVKRDDALTPWARLQHIDHRNVINRNNRYPDNAHLQMHNQVPLEMITTLVDCLPRITKLIVVQRFVDPSSLDQVIRMIDHWSDDLVTLELCLRQELGLWLVAGNRITDAFRTQMNSQTFKLFDSINRVTSLKHLKLDLDFVQKEHINLPPLTILSQLSSFCSGYLFRDDLDRTLLHSASGNGPLQIATSSYYKLDVLLRIDQEFCAKFVDVDVSDFLSVGGGDDDEDDEDDDDLNRNMRDMNNFCTRFTSLSRLHFQIGNISMIMLSRSLSHLTQLVHLSLMVFDHFGFDEENPEDQNIVPVPSVRLITMELYIESHNSTERLHLPEIFPNLQVLNIRNYTQSCSECEYDTDKGTVEIAPQIRQCAQLARKPFRHCPNLHTIEIDADDSPFLSGAFSTRLITRDEL